ncbi:MAG: sensor histidine kinase N-terminal domain-containing protein [Rubrivivax sp.]|nr:sensor histidine kinase N-terminal domain-containing protein [Rubrivivax sp.]
MLTTPAHEQRSLFGEILDWMLAPLLLLWPMSLGLTWLVAQSIANRPFDRELGDVVLALALQSRVQQVQQQQPGSGAGQAAAHRMELEHIAAALTRGDDDSEDLVYFQVLGERGELLAGDGRLPVPVGEPVDDRAVHFRDDMLGGEPVRVAYTAQLGRGDRGEALVQVAETLGKRSRLATEIIKGVLLPQFVMLPLAVLLVWFALARGIRPLAELQQRIRRRSSTDLSAIPTRDVPDEVRPLVDAINDLLQRLSLSIGAQRHFLTDAAHQLKTPLAGLRMQAELAARQIDGSPGGDTAAALHSLQQIALSSQRAAHMVNQLLALARADEGAQPVRREPVDLAALTREVLRDFVARAIERHIDLGYEGPGAETVAGRDGPEPVAVAPMSGEPVLLGELIRNLVDNALQYTPPGGRITVRVSGDAFGHTLLLQVEDTGPGIPTAEREAVFRPFYRVLGTQVDGSGLGLAIVQEIAQRHDAVVSVSDAEPRAAAGQTPGALFTVRFPAA